MNTWGQGTYNSRRYRKPPKKKKWPIVVIIAVAVIVAGVVLLVSFNGSDKKEPTSDSDVRQASRPVEEEEDIDAYFQERGQIIRRISADSSQSVLAESAVVNKLQSRGFTQSDITTEYTMDGTWSKATPVTGDAIARHPVYTTYYVTKAEEVWTLTDINGSLFAYPVSFNLDSGLSAQVILSETQIITSYDSHGDMFYETIPDPSALIVKTVPRIDAETLEKITAEELGK